MPDQPKALRFSVVIATYARGAMIDATLESVARQTATAHEIFVVSDGPAAPGLAESVADVGGARLLELPRRTRTQSGPNNEGWQHATGDWIAYLGHDDIWLPDHLARLSSAIARRPDADFAVSGLLYLGPGDADDDQTWVTGFFDDDDDEAPLREFFPPSSVAHRRELEGSRWPDIETVTLPVDAEFLRRHAEAGSRFVSTRSISVIKFASAMRYLSYAVPDDREQRRMLALSQDPGACEEFVAARLAVAREQGTFMHVKQVDRDAFAKGEIAARNERVRGIEIGELMPLNGKEWVPIGAGDRPPDWYAPESDDAHTWRWSGPSVAPKLLVPFIVGTSTRARICVRVLGFADEDLREEIRVRANGHEVDLDWEAGVEGRMKFTTPLLESAPTIVEILTNRTSPQVMARNRRVGIAVTGYDIAPFE